MKLYYKNLYLEFSLRGIGIPIVSLREPLSLQISCIIVGEV